MICLLAFLVFVILGIFSAKYRPYVREAFNCVFRRITLRSCTTGFDKKLKMKLVGKFTNKPRVARFIYKRFEILSWIFTIIFFVSVMVTANTIYNIGVYGSCSPDQEQCIFVDQTCINECLECQTQCTECKCKECNITSHTRT